MNLKRFPNLNSAYKEFLRDLMTNGIEVGSTTDSMSIGSDFGSKTRRTKEIIGYSFAIEYPNDRAVFLASRQINLPFAVANCIWTIAGLDNLDFINFYNERGKQFSDNQITLYGAHGKRLFNANGINQITAIIDRLKRDPYSRRTVATIYHPYDNQVVSRDIPCPIAIQFLQRDGKLHAVAYMRSQSAAMVLPYDVFVFTFLQEALAVELGLDLGTFYHVSGSFHYYLDEEMLIQKIVENDEISDSNHDIIVPQMPKTVSPLNMITAIWNLEREMQIQIQRSSGDFDFPIPNLPEYWESLVLILMIAIRKKNGKDSDKYISRLPKYYSRHFCTLNY